MFQKIGVWLKGCYIVVCVMYFQIAKEVCWVCENFVEMFRQVT